MGKNFRESLNIQMKNPEFKKEWDNLDTQFQIIKAIVEAREEQHITQKQLSEMTGIAQGDISKIENGNANPSVKTLNRIANAVFQPI
ncbi:MAG: helix-turn-helix transcriptional regulator [Tissierellia bacterium]|nr:helix-turn-helix transcriptional regulator [Tissierellia bacterium]